MIEIRDDAGNLTPSTATVTAAIATGAGALSGASVAAVAGVATFANLGISGLIGSYTLSFNSTGLISATSSAFTITVGQAATLRVRTQPSGARAGAPLTTQPVIEVADNGGNLVPMSGVAVTAAPATGGGSLAGATTTTVDGVAAFTALTVVGVIGPHTMTFSAAGLTPVTSATFEVGSGFASSLAIRAMPASAVNGVVLSPAPVIAAVDAAGNSTSASGTVTVSVFSGFASVSSASATLFNGTATFSSLALSGPVGSVSLMFQSAGLGPVNSAPIALAAGPAARIVVRTAPPSSVNNGVPMVPQPVVEIQDAGGNRVSANVLVTLTTNAISGTITNGSATTMNGVATFSGLTLSGPLGERDYWFTAAGLFSFTMRIGIQ